jgi:hypothetical protein
LRPKAVGWMPALCGLQTKQRGPDPTRHLYGREPFRWIQIVLTALVNDAKVALLLRIVIGDDPVDLV